MIAIEKAVGPPVWLGLACHVMDMSFQVGIKLKVVSHAHPKTKEYTVYDALCTQRLNYAWKTIHILPQRVIPTNYYTHSHPPTDPSHPPRAHRPGQAYNLYKHASGSAQPHLVSFNAGPDGNGQLRS